MSVEYWSWLFLECRISQFAIFRAYNGADLIRLDIKIKEGITERQSLEYGWSWPVFEEFCQSLTDFNRKVKKTDFKNKYLQYSSGTNSIQINFYFSKENWISFYEFISKVYREFDEQRKEFQEKFKKGGVKGNEEKKDRKKV